MATSVDVDGLAECAWVTPLTLRARAEGALCADSIRDFQRGEPAACLAQLEDVECGSFSSGALLIDEYTAGCGDE